MDGRFDPTFNPPELSSSTIGPGVLHFVILPSGRILIVGLFTSVDGIPMGGVARLNPDGTLDTTFNVGIGVNERIYQAAMDLNGDIYLAGLFSEFNGEPRAGIAKIYGTGEPSLDWRPTDGGAMEILWPGDREELSLESAEGISAYPWTLVTEPANKVQELNATTIIPEPPMRVFRLHAP
jgi:hypothetical protein